MIMNRKARMMKSGTICPNDGPPLGKLRLPSAERTWASDPAAAHALLAYLASPVTAPVKQRYGMEPAAC